MFLQYRTAHGRSAEGQTATVESAKTDSFFGVSCKRTGYKGARKKTLSGSSPNSSAERVEWDDGPLATEFKGRISEQPKRGGGRRGSSFFFRGKSGGKKIINNIKKGRRPQSESIL